MNLKVIMMNNRIHSAKQSLDKTFVAMKTTNGNSIVSGFENYDKITHGFLNGTLTVIASRPSMGKSAFIETIALYLAVDAKKNIGYFSIETNEDLLMRRFICNLSGLSLDDIISGRLTKEQWQHIENTIKPLQESSLFIDSSPEIDITELIKNANKLVSENNVEIMFIDYLQLITAKDFNTPNREQEIGYICRKLKSLAKELNIPIVLLSQLNRRGDTGKESYPREIYKKPQLADLRDSGTIEDVADVICFVHRPEYYGITMDENGQSTIGLVEIIISKNRHGRLDTLKLRLRKEQCRFIEYDIDEYEMPDFCQITTDDLF